MQCWQQKKKLLLVRRTQTVGSLNSKLIPASSREHDCLSHLNILPTCLMTLGQSQQAVKAREYTWPVPRPQLHLLLTGKFHSHWVPSYFFFSILRSYKGYYEVTMMHSKQLQHTAGYFSSPRKVELHFLSATLAVFKEKTPARFECSVWLSTTTGREKKRKLVSNFWEPIMRRKHNQHSTHHSLRWLWHQEVKSAADKCTLHLTKTY